MYLFTLPFYFHSIFSLFFFLSHHLLYDYVSLFLFFSLESNLILLITSNLGVQGVSHLLTNLGIYCKEEFSNCPSYEEHGLDDSSSNLETYSEYENMDLENFVYEKVSEEIEARKEASEIVPFLIGY